MYMPYTQRCFKGLWQLPSSLSFAILLLMLIQILVPAIAQEPSDPPTFAYQNPAYQNFLTEFKILDTELDYASLRDQVLLAINQLQISLQSVKENLQVHNISVHDMGGR